MKNTIKFGVMVNGAVSGTFEYLISFSRIECAMIVLVQLMHEIWRLGLYLVGWQLGCHILE